MDAPRKRGVPFPEVMMASMAYQDVTTTLGLRLPRGLAADFVWWLLLAAGVSLALAVFPVSGLDALPSLPAGGAQWLAVLLWQPVLEELAFRGLLQGLLREQPWGLRAWAGVSAANLGASAAFTAMHFLYHPPLWAAAVAVPSLVFGWLRDRHQSVWTPVIAHVAFNGGFFLGALLAAR